MIITDLILILISLTALIFATIVDIRIKEVPDWITYGLIASAISIRLLHSIIFTDWLYLIHGLLGLGITYLAGSILYHIKQWGGGDAKLLMGLGTALATKPSYLPNSAIPFLLTLFIYIIIIGAIYGIICSIYLTLKNINKFSFEFKTLLKSGQSSIIITISLLASIALIISIFFIDILKIKIMLLILAILLALYFYLFVAIKSVENIFFYKKVSPDKLVEGDWLASDVKIRKKTILNKKTILEKQHILELQKLNIKKVLIKEGIPFVPPFLIGTIIAILIGNPFF